MDYDVYGLWLTTYHNIYKSYSTARVVGRGVFAFTLFKQIASGAATNFYFSCISYKEQHIADSRAEPMITYPEDAYFSQDDKNMDTLKIEGVDFSYGQGTALYRELNFSLYKGRKNCNSWELRLWEKLISKTIKWFAFPRQRVCGY